MKHGLILSWHRTIGANWRSTNSKVIFAIFFLASEWSSRNPESHSRLKSGIQLNSRDKFRNHCLESGIDSVRPRIQDYLGFTYRGFARVTWSRSNCNYAAILHARSKQHGGCRGRSSTIFERLPGFSECREPTNVRREAENYRRNRSLLCEC